MYKGFYMGSEEDERRGVKIPEIALGNLQENPMARDICSSCGQAVILFSLYRGDTLFGERVKIPHNRCLRVCSNCGHQVREEEVYVR